MLEVDDLRVQFGGVKALDNANLRVEAGTIAALIGPNGAGKTTFFNCLSGLYRADGGTATWNGEQLIGRHPHQIAALGVARTFQNLALFETLTVRQNIRAGAHRLGHAGFTAGLLRTSAARAEGRRIDEQVDEIIDELGLGAVADRQVKGLPYGTMKRVELGRALALRPSLLLLDEPAAGLAGGEVAEFADLIRTIGAKRDLTILLVEHHMGLVMSLCSRVTVMNFGRTIAAGTPAEIQADRTVMAAYLGGAA